MALVSGTRLGPYEVVAPLGTGGMGEVYRATDTRLGRDVALKVLPHEFSRDPERLARFEREARIVAGLNHPSIVVLHSIEDSGDVRFITMELVEGSTLDTQVAPGGLPIERVMELGLALADALTAAHERGVVHRDLKPANVIVSRDGRVKVLDFGLAKHHALLSAGAMQSTGSAESQAATVATPFSTPGQGMGTAPYMAPEQLRGDPADARTDGFALGILLYDVNAGSRPFTGTSFAELSSSTLRDEPEPLRSLRVDIPPDLDRIVARCLEKSPERRYPSARELKDELQAAGRGRTPVAAAASPETSRPAAHDAPSIAVLPFVNLSRDEENEYFSDGLAEELLAMLAKIPGLRVAARTSSFHFKGKSPTLAEVGRALSVANVLEGSVRKAGDRVRITVQLVKVAGGYPLWSETYERTLEDIFAVQDEVASAGVAALRGEV